MKFYSVKINGKNILYKGQGSLVVTTHFSLWQRIKILFGKKCITGITIYTKDATTIVAHTITTTISKPPKPIL